ncbi:MAG: fimbrial protein [Comamonadaceae bacterium]|nr:MAG: fimbrial protein [Comamonadaceae bacterium]
MVAASASTDTALRLRSALAPVAAVHASTLDPAEVLQRLDSLRAAALLVDFTEATRPQAAALADAVRLHGSTRLVGVGHAACAADAIAALRANVHEFLDVDGAPADLQQVLQRLLAQRQQGTDRHGPTIALLGARGGLGVSTLAANLALLLQQGPATRTLLTDMGLPVADSRTILGVESGFSFAEAARSLDRLDSTLVDSAIPRSSHGIAVLPLPAQLQELRDISHVAATSVIARLQHFFDAVVLDLGGFTYTDFLLRVAASCDHCLLVCDQATTSVFSTARLAGELAERGVACRLVVNRWDASLAPTLAQLAEHLKLPLAAVLPDRYAAQVRALNEGRLLAASANDPYTRALQALACSLVAGNATASQAGAGWRNRLRRLGRAAAA